MIKYSKLRQQQYDLTYLKMACEWANLSYCTRKKVGALIVKNDSIISDGYNGTPSGFENICEDENGLTKWYVLHAEANAILKVARNHYISSGACIYITHAPCNECSKLIYQGGIIRVVYIEDGHNMEGVDFLKNAGILVDKINLPL